MLWSRLSLFLPKGIQVVTVEMMPPELEDARAEQAVADSAPAVAPPPAPRSLVQELAGLRTPGEPPAGWVAICCGLFAAALVGLAIAGYAGWRYYAWPAHYLQDYQWGTWLSAGPLLLSSLVGLALARRWWSRPQRRRFWLLVGLSLLVVGIDDLMRIHENIEDLVIAWFSLPEDHPIANRINDAVVAAYGVLATIYAWRRRDELLRYPWACIALGAGGVFFAGMVFFDVLHISASVEESLKVMATICILSALLAVHRTRHPRA